MNVVVFKLLADNAVRLLTTERKVDTAEINKMTKRLASTFNNYKKQPKRCRKNYAMSNFVDCKYSFSPWHFVALEVIPFTNKEHINDILFVIAQRYRKQGYVVLNKQRC